MLSEMQRLKLFDVDSRRWRRWWRGCARFPSRADYDAFARSVELTDEEIGAILGRELRVARYLDNRLKLAAQLRESELLTRPGKEALGRGAGAAPRAAGGGEVPAPVARAARRPSPARVGAGARSPRRRRHRRRSSSMAVRLRPRLGIRRMTAADLEEVMVIERAAFRHPWSPELFRRELEHDWSTILSRSSRSPAPADGAASGSSGSSSTGWCTTRCTCLNVAVGPSTAAAAWRGC